MTHILIMPSSLINFRGDLLKALVDSGHKVTSMVGRSFLKSIHLSGNMKNYGDQVDCYDPWINPAEAEHEYGITPISKPAPGAYDAVILAVAHRQFADMGAEQIRALGKLEHVLYDLKYILPADASDLRL